MDLCIKHIKWKRLLTAESVRFISFRVQSEPTAKVDLRSDEMAIDV